MEKDTTLQSLGEIAIAAIPVAGFFSGHSKGVQDGYEKSSEEYEKKARVLRERMMQIKRDVLGDNEIFIYPAGWDEEYWLKILSEFINEHSDEKSDGKTLLLEFIDLCLEKFPQDKLAETRHQLRIIKKVLKTAPSSRLSLDQGDLELSIHFLDVFGKPFGWENNVDNPSMEAIAAELIQLRDEIKSAMAPIKECNILILGKTGAGKSSLLNYIVDKELFRVGVGKPVTKKGIHPQSAWIDNLKVTVYDSWGLECGDSFNDWQDILKQEKQKHDLRQDVLDWFHAIIYCIQAPGSRIESIDIDILNSFLDEKYHVVVALTKADLCTEEEEAILRKTLLENCINLSPQAIIGVCSEEKNVRGTVHQKFGRDELKKAILNGYIGTIVNRMPKRCVYLGVEELNIFCSNTRKEISKRSQWDDNEEWFKEKCEDFVNNFNKKTFPKIIQDEITSCAAVSLSLSSMIKSTIRSFSPNNYNITDDFDEWYVKSFKVAAFVSFLPVVIITGLISGSDWERKKLTNRLDCFQETTRESIEKLEKDIREKLKTAIDCQN
jgi:predicted GTPase